MAPCVKFACLVTIFNWMALALSVQTIASTVSWILHTPCHSVFLVFLLLLASMISYPQYANSLFVEIQSLLHLTAIMHLGFLMTDAMTTARSKLTLIVQCNTIRVKQLYAPTFSQSKCELKSWSENLKTVSYTHLDVYKRQGCRWTSSSCWWAARWSRWSGRCRAVSAGLPLRPCRV